VDEEHQEVKVLLEPGETSHCLITNPKTSPLVVSWNQLQLCLKATSHRCRTFQLLSRVRMWRV